MDYFVKNNNEINNFYSSATKNWNKLMLGLLGETLPSSEFINGIRFVDKSNLGKKTMFRFEIWANKYISKEQILESKEFYKIEFGCSGLMVKDIQ